MQTIRTAKQLREYLDNQRSQSLSIGFVPTMGALHEGHISLLERSRQENECNVVSIFVNPTQFDRAEDLSNYPRTEEEDAERLEQAGCQVLFYPTVDEIYPNGAEVSDHFDFNGLDVGMEGDHRPGHFAGVAQVVKNLLEIVEPDHIYMGQKDYQQYRIIDALVKLLNMSVEVRMCPIIREPDGLAMSSRNMRLSEEEREQAQAISAALFNARAQCQDLAPLKVADQGMEALVLAEGVNPEYFEVVDADSLQVLESWEGVHRVLIAAAAFVGPVRLIDNVLVPLA
jgi:pantoate--beta-alanine ligase